MLRLPIPPEPQAPIKDVKDLITRENVKTRYCGDLAELPALDMITRQLECPACYEIPMPPIYLCTAGHNVCLSCKSKMASCPLCKSQFSTTRNFVMEGMINNSKFYCNYKNHGCMDLIVGEEFQNHVQNCIYRNGAIPPPLVPKKPQNESSSTSTTANNANQGSSGRQPPLLPPKRSARLGGCCQWILSTTNDPIPWNAVQGGFEDGDLLYVARSSFNGGCFPGKLNAESKQHFYPLGAEGRVSNEYEILTAVEDSVKWVTVIEGKTPANPVIGGRTELGEALYIGRCGFRETLTVGWILPCKNAVTSVHNGVVISSSIFEVLVKTELGIALDLSAN